MNPRIPRVNWVFLVALSASLLGNAGDTMKIARAQPASLARYVGRVDANSPKRVDVPWNDGDIASVTLDGGPRRYVKYWQRASDGRSVRVWMEWVPGGEPPAALTIESIPRTGQTPDGRWSFRIEDARSVASGPNAARTHEWTFEPTRGGNYQVEITGAAWDQRTEAVEVDLCGQTKIGQLDFTEGRSRLASKSIGRLRVPGAGRQVLRVRVGESNRGLQGAISAIVLRPAPEGARLRAEGDGSFRLRAADAALAGESMSVIGWGDAAVAPAWTEEAARLEWVCDDVRPGRYRVEIAVNAGVDASGEIEVGAFGQAMRSPLMPGSNATRVLGEIEATRGGEQTIWVRPRGARGDWSVASVRLVRAEP